MKDSRTSDSADPAPSRPQQPLPKPLPEQRKTPGWAALFGRTAQQADRREVRLEAQRSCGMGGV
jgi:hypothetical protein